VNIFFRTTVGYRWWLVFGVLIAVYLIINLGLSYLPLNATVRSHVIPPVLWLLLALVVRVSPGYRTAGKLGAKTAIIQLSLMIGFFQVILYVIGGLFSKFGNSPYSFTPLGIAQNLFLVVAMLVGMEMSRAWLINHLGRSRTLLALAFVTLFYTVASIPLSQVAMIRPNVESISFLNSTLIPSLAENMLASMLALQAGPLAAIAYRGLLQGFWWFSPILPDLPWVFKGLLGTAAPIVGLAVVQSLYPLRFGRDRVKKTNAGSPTSWIITTVFCVVIIWFAVGLFPFHPSVVLSGSMRPIMDAGDVVMVAKIPTDTLEVGDIIQFRAPGDITIMHRLIEIQEEGDVKLFITKGDDNDSPDSDPVIPENVVGKVVFTVPKVGWMAIVIKNFFTG
jgi:signal peptidase